MNMEKFGLENRETPAGPEAVEKIKFTNDLEADAHKFLLYSRDLDGLGELRGKNEEEILNLLSEKRKQLENAEAWDFDTEVYLNTLSALLDHHLTRLERFYKDDEDRD